MAWNEPIPPYWRAAEFKWVIERFADDHQYLDPVGGSGTVASEWYLDHIFYPELFAEADLAFASIGPSRKG